jgi:hypothetical protein
LPELVTGNASLWMLYADMTGGYEKETCMFSAVY